jgi:ribosomal protein S6--L-glutamate ligase
MNIGIIMFRHGANRKSPIMPEVIRLLAEWDAMVEVIYPEERTIDLGAVRPEHDLYVLKSGSELALSLAGALHAAGATMVNPYPVAAMMRDKIVSTRVLQAAGVPVPQTFVTAHPKLLAGLLDEPLVVKPYRGSQGRGVHVVWDPEELDDISSEGAPVFAQRYHKPQGEDRKIYCIGGQMFGVLRVWPPKTYEEKLGQPFTITPELREIALAAGRAFGVDLFGLDVIISEGKPYVVDIQSFPGFKGVPDAALRLADYIYTAGQRVLAGGRVAATAAVGLTI